MAENTFTIVADKIRTMKKDLEAASSGISAVVEEKKISSIDLKKLDDFRASGKARVENKVGIELEDLSAGEKQEKREKTIFIPEAEQSLRLSVEEETPEAEEKELTLGEMPRIAAIPAKPEATPIDLADIPVPMPQQIEESIPNLPIEQTPALETEKTEELAVPLVSELPVAETKPAATEAKAEIIEKPATEEKEEKKEEVAEPQAEQKEESKEEKLRKITDLIFEIEQNINQITEEKFPFEERKKDIDKEIEKNRKRLDLILERRKRLDELKHKIEEKESAAATPEEKRDAEKERWKVEDERYMVEQEKNQKEDEIKSLRLQLKECD
ncbi:MAG: hypothetical protein PHG23_03445, partial [Candidatus Pacebacteria bacterium]|nr:hypothetical protein [Candidatus Paceibacterota bacterium]